MSSRLNSNPDDLAPVPDLPDGAKNTPAKYPNITKMRNSELTRAHLGDISLLFYGCHVSFPGFRNLYLQKYEILTDFWSPWDNDELYLQCSLILHYSWHRESTMGLYPSKGPIWASLSLRRWQSKILFRICSSEWEAEISWSPHTSASPCHGMVSVTLRKVGEVWEASKVKPSHW